jgi:hypothetical protein
VVNLTKLELAAIASILNELRKGVLDLGVSTILMKEALVESSE